MQIEKNKQSIELEAKKNFDELIESCNNLTIEQKRVAFTRIIKDEVEPGEIGVAVRRMLSNYLKTFPEIYTEFSMEKKVILKEEENLAIKEIVEVIKKRGMTLSNFNSVVENVKTFMNDNATLKKD